MVNAQVSFMIKPDGVRRGLGDANFRVPVVPGFDKLVNHPLAIISFVPRELALFFAGAVAGAAAKTVTAPLDRVKLLMQVHGVRMAQEGSKNNIKLMEAVARIGKEEGIAGYWKGNIPQVIRVIPYSAVQLFAYEAYKKLFKGEKEELSVVGRLAAGACAGMTSTLVTYPLDVLRLRLAVDSTTRSMGQVAQTMLREEGMKSFYKGLGPSLLGIAPYIALNFCVFDLVKKSLPEDFRKRPEASFMTALVSKGGSGDGTFSLASNGSPRVVFILGGPGSGKGTQCQKIVDKFGFVHLSAGDLLRAEIQSGSEYGDMIKNMIKDGKIVPSEVTVRLLLRAMGNSKGEKFLIDGFPRNDENRAVFERMTGIVPEFILFFDCPEDEMERRVLGRNQGRADDNKETMQKRLKVFVDFSVPVVKYYESMGKVHKVSATGSIDDIHTTIEPLFEQFSEAHSTGDAQYATGKFDRSPANN